LLLSAVVDALARYHGKMPLNNHPRWEPILWTVGVIGFALHLVFMASD
jgi:hypothetical protein